MVAAAAASVLTNLQLPPAMIRNGHDKVVPVPAAADAGVAAAAAAARTEKGGGLEKERRKEGRKCVIELDHTSAEMVAVVYWRC